MPSFIIYYYSFFIITSSTHLTFAGECKDYASGGNMSQVCLIFLTRRASVMSQGILVLMLTKDKRKEAKDERDVLSPPISHPAMRQRPQDPLRRGMGLGSDASRSQQPWPVLEFLPTRLEVRTELTGRLHGFTEFWCITTTCSLHFQVLYSHQPADTLHCSVGSEQEVARQETGSGSRNCRIPMKMLPRSILFDLRFLIKSSWAASAYCLVRFSDMLCRPKPSRRNMSSISASGLSELKHN